MVKFFQINLFTFLKISAICSTIVLARLIEAAHKHTIYWLAILCHTYKLLLMTWLAKLKKKNHKFEASIQGD